MQIKDLTIRCDQIRRHRVPESCAPFFRTLLSCQNPINCHMGPTNLVFHENPVFFRFTNKCLVNLYLNLKKTIKAIKRHQQIAISSKFEGFPVSRHFLGGSFFQNGFSPKAVQPEVPGVRGDPKANLEVFCREATFQFTVKC